MGKQSSFEQTRSLSSLSEAQRTLISNALYESAALFLRLSLTLVEELLLPHLSSMCSIALVPSSHPICTGDHCERTRHIYWAIGIGQAISR